MALSDRVDSKFDMVCKVAVVAQFKIGINTSISSSRNRTTTKNISPISAERAGHLTNTSLKAVPLEPTCWSALIFCVLNI